MGKDNNNKKSTNNDVVPGASRQETDPHLATYQFFVTKLDETRENYHNLNAKCNALEGKCNNQEEKYKNLEGKYNNLEGKYNNLEEENKKLREQIANILTWKDQKEVSDTSLKNENTKLKQDHQQSLQAIDEMEMSQRRPYLVINNLPEETSRKDENIFMELATVSLGLGDSITKDDISSVSRLKGNYRNAVTRTATTKPNAMLIKFQNEKARNLIFSNKKQLKGSGKVINEFLTPRRSALLKECYDLVPGTFKDRSIWTHNGRILIRKSGDGNTTCEIKYKDDIMLFLAKHNLTARDPHTSHV